MGILKQGQEGRFLLAGQRRIFDAGGDFVVDLQAAAVEVDRADPAQAVVADGGFAVVETGQVFIDLDAFPDLLFEGVADHPARGVVRQQVVFQVDGLPGPCDVLQEQFPFPFAGRGDLQSGRLRPERQQAAEE